MVVTSVPARLDREHVAGLHRLAVDEHGAGAALRRVAADVGAREAQSVAQEIDEQGSGFDLGGDGLAVHRQGDG
jgi:hypothetical protein